MRWHARAFENTQLPQVNLAADFIAREQAGGKKTVAVSAGHMAWTLVGRYEDEAWAIPFDVHMNVYDQVDGYRKNAPDGALVLRLGYCGFHKSESELFQSKHNRVLLITAPHESPDFRYTANLPVQISTMAAFGDACVTIKGYPLRMFPVTGWMQVLAYESVNVEVLDRMGKPRPAEKADAAAGQ